MSRTRAAHRQMPSILEAAFGILLALALSFLVGCATLWAGLGPQGPAPDTPSARRLTAGPYAVERRNLTLVDSSRPTPANGSFQGSASRTLEVTLWVPKDATSVRPLVIYSHGFLSNRWEGQYLAKHLASHGTAVAAPDYPLTHRGAQGGPEIRDVVHQPGDVSFLIDRILALGAPDDPVGVPIDPERIAAVGLSLGGFTTMLVAFHPERRDERIRAAISIAAPSTPFSRHFFAHSDVPFLAIAATHDAIVPYAANAPPLLERAPTSSLLSIGGGSHVGFAGLAATVPFLRFSHNPDGLGCSYLEKHLDLDPDELEEEAIWAELGGAESGIAPPRDVPFPCQQSDLPRSIRPPRQQIITKLAVRAFLDSQLGERAETRRAAARYLADELEVDFPEVEYASAVGGLRSGW